jgi:hypothetical protein
LGEVIVQETEASLKDLMEAHKLVPTDQAIKKELERVRLQIETQRKKERAAFGKMFG